VTSSKDAVSIILSPFFRNPGRGSGGLRLDAVLQQDLFGLERVALGYGRFGSNSFRYRP
jgi:hypothetical protein